MGVRSLPVLSHNKIVAIDVGPLSQLKKLQLSHNRLHSFPDLKVKHVDCIWSIIYYPNTYPICIQTMLTILSSSIEYLKQLIQNINN